MLIRLAKWPLTSKSGCSNEGLDMLDSLEQVSNNEKKGHPNGGSGMVWS